MRSQDHALHYSASRGKNSAYVVTHHSVRFIYLTLSFPLALASTSRNWPRPHSPGLGLGLGLGLEALASASASSFWPRLTSLVISDFLPEMDKTAPFCPLYVLKTDNKISSVLLLFEEKSNN